ncbi:DUF6173 family protein [Marinibacterium profundimaris]|uniref:DUF6173 family protein n=1 Tax=Marinibacterium profundimaris TaxID=1679460 RepID=UPI000B527411|nr:DUF6173 family protein [Marinibacterium profundimaris]
MDLSRDTDSTEPKTGGQDPDSAIPRRHEVHCSDEARPPSTVPETLKKPVDAKSPARWAYERLVVYLKNFEEQLNADQEVAMGFAGSDAGVLRIEGMGYFDPDIVTFYGADASGARTQLIQHVSQLNVLLRATPRPTEDEPPVRIGFRLAADLEDDSADGGTDKP